MSSSHQTAVTVIQTILSAKPSQGIVVTQAVIEEETDRVLQLFPDLQSLQLRREIIEELETRFHVWIGNVRTLGDNSDHVVWLPAKRDAIKWEFWGRYVSLLQGQMAQPSIEKLDEITDEILGRLEDPKRVGAWSRRGLVVGHVQSGKTANYIGLINKAADAGYKLIVVLAGLHRNLRSQTQIRLDEGFLGYDSSPSIPGQGSFKGVGVGLINPSLRPDSITNRLDAGDFKRSVAANFGINPGGTPLLFVIKKNASVLKNLLGWVEWAANSKDTETGRPIVSGVPLLVIDDEADQASVDTKEIEVDESGVPNVEHDPTIINGRIRRLLHCFEQNAYVGYTATPFANIYIHEKALTIDEGEDLFPRSFIMNLPAPSNYFGPAALFGTADSESDMGPRTGALPLVRIIKDYIDHPDKSASIGWMPLKHKISHIPQYRGANSIPPSLAEALRAFVLSAAARKARGQAVEHNSMLIHVTRFTDIQRKVHEQVSMEVSRLRSRWRNGDGASQSNLRSELETLWQNDFVKTTRAMAEYDFRASDWSDVEVHVAPVVESILIKTINGSSADILAYEENRLTGINVIAIGGDKLSRGLTLDGLTTSYFLRSATMYDTLMQMGRWFGYRTKYADLCRLYVTEELEEWFGHITDASEELRQQFDHMVAVGGTPRDYGLRVKSHPVLLVTSSVKSRTGTELQLTYSGDISETIAFHKDPVIIKGNAAVTEDFIKVCGHHPDENRVQDRLGGKRETWRGAYVWDDVPGLEVARYIRRIETHPAARRVNRDLLARYITMQIGQGELVKWTVGIMSGEGAPTNFAGLRVQVVARQDENPEGSYYRIGRLLSPRDEGVDLGSDEYLHALEATRTAWTQDPGRSKRTTPPDVASGRMLRQQRPATRGLLLIYPLEPAKEGLPPFIGLGLSFPGSNNHQTVSYKVNNIYFEQEFGATA